MKANTSNFYIFSEEKLQGDESYLTFHKELQFYALLIYTEYARPALFKIQKRLGDRQILLSLGTPYCGF